MSKITEEFPGAEYLIAAGYTTKAKVRNASDEDLLAVEHIGPGTLEKIRAAQEEAPTADASEDVQVEEAVVVAHKCSNPACGYEITESPCPYCGTV